VLPYALVKGLGEKHGVPKKIILFNLNKYWYVGVVLVVLEGVILMHVYFKL